ncbi:MAG: hypothetical protein AB7V50_06560, partial [Vampirovibrionia bacterium]
MSLNFNMPLFPAFNLNQTNSTGSYASATASAGNGFASASASAGSCGLFDGAFNQMNSAIGCQNNDQNGFMQMLMQLIQTFMQMMQQFMGQGQNNQNQYPYSNNNSGSNGITNPYGNNGITNPYGNNGITNPYGNTNATANTTAGNGSAAANASAGNATASAYANSGANNALLSKVDQSELDAVKGKDLGAVDKNGYPKYLVSKAKDGKYHIYEGQEKSNGKTYKCVSKVKQGSNILHV